MSALLNWQCEDRAQQTVARSEKDRRDPFLEFYDHGVSISEDENETSTTTRESCCYFSKLECSQMKYPYLSSFDNLSELACKEMTASLELALGRRRMLFGGWTASIHMTATDINAKLLDQEVSLNDESSCFVGGFVCDTDAQCPTMLLRDSCQQIPVSILEEHETFEVGDFVLGKVAGLVASCLCFNVPKKTYPMKTKTLTNLSPFSSGRYTSHKDMKGNCYMMEMNGYIFLVSVQVLLHTCTRVDEGIKAKVSRGLSALESTRHAGLPRDIFERCLSQPQSLAVEPSTKLKCILVRQRFRYARINAQSHLSTSCFLTLSHLPTNGEQISTIQSFELKVSVLCETSRRHLFKHALSRIGKADAVTDDNVALGLSWWNLAGSFRTCGIAVGGWDELVQGSSSCGMRVCLDVPLSVLSAGSRGHVRAACTSSELGVSLRNIMDSNYVDSWVTGKYYRQSESGDGFSFVGGRKVFDGMLDRRLSRACVPIQSAESPVGEIWSLSRDAIPIVGLQDLFQALCFDLKGRTKHNLAPSLVRRLAGSKLLGIQFCSITRSCSRCFNTVKLTRKRSRKEDDEEETSFWNNPLPVCLNDEGRSKGNTLSGIERRLRTDKIPGHVPVDSLQCPKGCAPDGYFLKWEASAIVDDGRGQGKLYSEREAALTLLGMSPETVQSIEDGVWGMESGVLQFQKSFPPSKSLQTAVSQALSSAGRRNKKNAIYLLSREMRAKYLLEHHCRYSRAPFRPLDYLIRCKPLADEAQLLNQTEIESFFSTKSDGFVSRIDSASYSLPPLKLQLVDCCKPAADTRVP